MKQQLNNRTIFHNDNIDILRGINSNSIQLIYIDPPFNKNEIFHAAIGSSAEGASFDDVWKDVEIKEEWLKTIEEDEPKLYTFLSSMRNIEGQGSSTFCYLAYMSIRLLEMHRILKPTGSIYIHCDPTMSHYLKIVMDCIYGKKNFINEIVWGYKSGGASKRWFGKKHDIILFYSKTSEYIFNIQKSKSYLSHKYGFKNANIQQDKDGYYTMINTRDIWNIDIVGRNVPERTGYPTQKPLPLLERIIKASSNEGDIVLDAFCGCATTCVAAERLARQWVGIDKEREAFDLVKERLEKETLYTKLDEEHRKITYTQKPPTRTTEDSDEEQKYVYVMTNETYEKDNKYKVGVAKDAKSRRGGLETGSPDVMVEKFSLLTPHYRQVEANTHKNFPRTNTKKEWIVGDLQEIIDFIKSEDERQKELAKQKQEGLL